MGLCLQGFKNFIFYLLQLYKCPYKMSLLSCFPEKVSSVWFCIRWSTDTLWWCIKIVNLFWRLCELKAKEIIIKHNQGPYFGQQTKEKVKLLIQLADSFVEKGHIHATEIRKWVTTVDKRYRDFSLRMGKYRYSLEKALGINPEVL